MKKARCQGDGQSSERINQRRAVIGGEKGSEEDFTNVKMVLQHLFSYYRRGITYSQILKTSILCQFLNRKCKLYVHIYITVTLILLK